MDSQDIIGLQQEFNRFIDYIKSYKKIINSIDLNIQLFKRTKDDKCIKDIDDLLKSLRG